MSHSNDLIFKKNNIYLALCIIFIIGGSYLTIKGFTLNLEGFDEIIKKIKFYKDNITIFCSSFLIGLVMRRYELLKYRTLSLALIIVLFFSNNLSFIPICIFFGLSCFSLATLFRKFFKIPKNEHFLNFYLGYVFLLILLTFFSFYPINNALFYLSIFSTIIILTFKENKYLYKLCLSKITSNENVASSVSHLFVLAFLSVYLFSSLMPSEGLTLYPITYTSDHISKILGTGATISMTMCGHFFQYLQT